MIWFLAYIGAGVVVAVAVTAYGLRELDSDDLADGLFMSTIALMLGISWPMTVAALGIYGAARLVRRFR